MFFLYYRILLKYSNIVHKVATVKAVDKTLNVLARPNLLNSCVAMYVCPTFKLHCSPPLMLYNYDYVQSYQQDLC